MERAIALSGAPTAILLCLVAVAVAARGQAQEWLDQVDEKLTLNSNNGFLRSSLSGLVDVEGYYVDERPPGLLQGYQSFANFCTTFFVDAALGEHFYAFLQARLDRGFDPAETDFEARLDEYLLRWTPFNDTRLNLQVGKFATVVGNWVPRHDSWLNPLITAPLPYDNLSIVSDEPPASPADFLARRTRPDNKDSWLPIVWGPAYTSGGTLFGAVGKVDYAFAVKNAALSSNPYAWDLTQNQWQYLNFSGRLGFRPNAAWNHGVSFAVGPYLDPEAADELPPGKSTGDYNQITLVYDVSYAWHHWQLWGEVFLNRFQVPNVGNADSVAYYLLAKYQLTPQLYLAAEWNQQIYGTVADGAGGRQEWDNNMVRVDLAMGYRFTRHFQAKLQYSFGHRNGSLQQGEQLVAAQITMKF